MNERRHNTPEEIIEIVTGYLNGRVVEARYVDWEFSGEGIEDDWSYDGDPCWNFEEVQYRLR